MLEEKTARVRVLFQISTTSPQRFRAEAQRHGRRISSAISARQSEYQSPERQLRPAHGHSAIAPPWIFSWRDTAPALAVRQNMRSDASFQSIIRLATIESFALIEQQDRSSARRRRIEKLRGATRGAYAERSGRQRFELPLARQFALRPPTPAARRRYSVLSVSRAGHRSPSFCTRLFCIVREFLH